MLRRFCPGGCRRLVVRGRCAQCQRLKERQRGSSTERGYGYDHQQQRARLMRNPVCALCGDTAGPFHADHIIPKAAGGTNEESNYQLLCERCNLEKGSILE